VQEHAADDGPPALDFFCQSPELGERHPLVGLVGEPLRLAVTRYSPGYAGEEANATGALIVEEPQHIGERELSVGETDPAGTVRSPEAHLSPRSSA
jgi:hypothetical protein